MRWRWMKKTYMENGGKAGSFWFVKADPKNSLPLFVFALHRFPIFSAPLFASFSFRSVLNCKESGLTEHARTSSLRSERTCANAAIYREKVRLSIFVYPAVSIRRSVRVRSFPSPRAPISPSFHFRAIFSDEGMTVFRFTIQNRCHKTIFGDDKHRRTFYVIPFLPEFSLFFREFLSNSNFFFVLFGSLRAGSLRPLKRFRNVVLVFRLSQISSHFLPFWSCVSCLAAVR